MMSTDDATPDGRDHLAPRLPIAKIEYWREGVLAVTLLMGLATIFYFVPVDMASNPGSTPLVLAASLAAAVIFVVAFARRERAFEILQKYPWIGIPVAAIWGAAIAGEGIGTLNANLYYASLPTLILAGAFGGVRIGAAAGASQVATAVFVGAWLHEANPHVGYAPDRAQAIAGFIGAILFPAAAGLVSQFYERVIALRALQRQALSEGPEPFQERSEPPGLPRPRADAILWVAKRYNLTSREISVFIQLMHGRSAVHAAVDLHLSTRQANRAVDELRAKLGEKEFEDTVGQARRNPTRAEMVGRLTRELTKGERDPFDTPESAP